MRCKTVIFGDSYSTFEGFVPEGYAVYYGCEKHPENQLKKNRIESIREKMARFKENEKKRLEKEKLKELNEESGIQVYVK